MKRHLLVISSIMTLILVLSVVSAPIASATPIIHVPLSGTLLPNQSNLYGPYSLRVGSTVHIVLQWTPKASTLAYGVVPAASTGTIQGCQNSGGSGNCNITIHTAGSYYVIVANKTSTSTGATTYNGYADIDICPPCL